MGQESTKQGLEAVSHRLAMIVQDLNKVNQNAHTYVDDANKRRTTS